MKSIIAIVVMSVLFTPCLYVCAQDTKADLEKLQGDWSIVAMEMNGKESPKAMTDNLRITFKENTMTMTRVKTNKGNDFTIKLDTSKKPKAIDLVPVEGKAKGMTVRGIYQFDGSELKLVMSNTSENERPTEFKAPKDSELFVMTLMRKK